MPIALQKLDELYIPNHYYLDDNDDCYFILTYTIGQGYEYSSHNRFIINLKKSMDKRNTPQWKYKIQAIEEAAQYLSELNINQLFPNAIFIPMPPSKEKSNEYYDDRLYQILLKACNGSLDVREVVLQKKSTDSYHISGERRDINDIYNNLYIDEVASKNMKNDIVIFDDVLTSGAHFKATSKLLKDKFPNVNIHGLFLARSVNVPSDMIYC